MRNGTKSSSEPTLMRWRCVHLSTVSKKIRKSCRLRSPFQIIFWNMLLHLPGKTSRTCSKHTVLTHLLWLRCIKHVSKIWISICIHQIPIARAVLRIHDLDTRFWYTESAVLYTRETFYSTIYYSKYFIELNFDKSTQYVALWTHKRHPIPSPFGRAMECLLWVLQQKLTVL